MKKEVVRREFLKLKNKDLSYDECKRILKEEFQVEFSSRTLKRWLNRFVNEDCWNLKDESTRPKIVRVKFSDYEREAVLALRIKTGYSAYQLKNKLSEKSIFMSESYIKKLIKDSGLSRGNKMEGVRLKWVRFERDTPNSMWQVDGTQEEDGTWILPVEDDCSRYCLAITRLKEMTTQNVINVLVSAIRMHGKPREILTDNGPEYGGRCKDSEFDRWCENQGIKHIRSGVHKPTTVGKVSRIQFTISYELPYCNYDYEYFRYRYNHERPHRSLNGLTPAQVYFGFKRHKKYSSE